MKALAVKYRPHDWASVTEQDSVCKILNNQISTKTIRNGYLFCGGAGTGKTTCARIFAKQINNGKGEPIELDAASNNSVEDVRKVIEQAQTQSLDSEYKVFILDECHSLSSQGWQAMLKTLEEPPAKSVFIFCTTNPERIPNTILSRVQRFNFQRISQSGIIKRLKYILDEEINSGRNITYELPAVELIAKIADGGMRDAITLTDKCLSYSAELTTDTVVKALGIADYDVMIRLTNAVLGNKVRDVIDILNGVHKTGIDLKQFIKNYFEYILDVNILHITHDPDDTKLPDNVAKLELSKKFDVSQSQDYSALLNFLVDLQPKIKWEQNAKAVSIAEFMVFMDNYFKGRMTSE